MQQIDRVETFNLNDFIDDRGYITQIFDKVKHKDFNIKRMYISENFDKGTIRGFHMHRTEHKLFLVLKGTARFVLVKCNDCEAYVPNDVKNIVISAKQPKLLYVPTYFFTGWQALEDDTIIMGISDKNLDETTADDYRLDPYMFGDSHWEVKDR